MVENCLGYKFHPDVKPEAPLIFLGVQVQLAEREFFILLKN